MHSIAFFPEIYVDPAGFADPDVDDVRDLAERSVAFDIGLRLQISDSHAHESGRTALTARADLPRLWRVVPDGFAPFPLVEATTAAAIRLAVDAGASAEEGAESP